MMFSAGTTSQVLSCLWLCEILRVGLRRIHPPPRLLPYLFLLPELSVPDSGSKQYDRGRKRD